MFTFITRSAVVAVALCAAVASAQTANPVSCSFEATNLGNGKTKLVWGSANAVFASIDNNVGTVAADGEREVPTLSSGTYTLHVWNLQGTGAYCTPRMTTAGGAAGSAAGGVANPIVTLTTTGVTGNPNVIALNTVPYTGATEYISFAIFFALAVSAAYAAQNSKRVFA
ncbi:MAG: hypothetical protein RI911_349 [Candidatus Parcubacteria bacterium]